MCTRQSWAPPPTVVSSCLPPRGPEGHTVSRAILSFAPRFPQEDSNFQLGTDALPGAT